MSLVNVKASRMANDNEEMILLAKAVFGNQAKGVDNNVFEDESCSLENELNIKEYIWACSELTPGLVENVLASSSLHAQLKHLKRNVIECRFNDYESFSASLNLNGQHFLKADNQFATLYFFPKKREKKSTISMQGIKVQTNISSSVGENNEKSEFFRMLEPWAGEHPEIKGLFMFRDFGDLNLELFLSHTLRNNPQEWTETVHRRQPKNRRVKHYGYTFDYGTRRCNPDEPLGEFPNWLKELTKKVNSAVNMCLLKNCIDIKETTWIADQVTVNEYISGQGIAPHVDTHSAFFDGIASLSILSDIVMRFAPKGNKSKQIDVLLPRLSLLVMTRDARFHYTHAIPQRKNDVIEGQVIPRKIRISLTFRMIKSSPLCSGCISPDMCDLVYR